LNRWTATDKRWNRKTVSRGSVVLDQTPSNLLSELLSTDTHGSKNFQNYWEKVEGLSEQAVSLVPATGGGGIFTPQCSFSRKSPTKQWIKTVSFRDIVTDPFGFLKPLSVSLYLLPVLRGRSASNVHETGFPTIQQ